MAREPGSGAGTEEPARPESAAWPTTSPSQKPGCSPGSHRQAGVPQQHQLPVVVCPAYATDPRETGATKKIMRSDTTIKHLLIGHLAKRHHRVCDAALVAHVGRDTNQLAAFARYSLGPLSEFYRAVLANRTGHREDAETAAYHLIRTGPREIQARALVLVAGNLWERHDPDGAMRCYERAGRITSDPTTAITIVKMRSVIFSCADRDHRRALRELEQAVQLASIVTHIRPLYLEFVNALAVESLALGQLDRARDLIVLLSRSPYLSRFPEWQQTIEDERFRCNPRSVVCLPSRSADVITFPSRTQAPPARLAALRFDAMAVPARTSSDTLLRTIVRLGEVSDRRHRACADLLDAVGPNFELAAKAPHMSNDVAQRLLGIALTYTEPDDGEHVQVLTVKKGFKS
jgi:hypothetical protein